MCEGISVIRFRGSEQPNTKPDKSQPATSSFQQRRQNKTKIETIDKLRQFGLSDEQIAEALELPLEVVKQVEFEVSDETDSTQ
jgi:predicted transposase YdaD